MEHCPSLGFGRALVLPTVLRLDRRDVDMADDVPEYRHVLPNQQSIILRTWMGEDRESIPVLITHTIPVYLHVAVGIHLASILSEV